jgi:hypothetical protein
MRVWLIVAVLLCLAANAVQWRTQQRLRAELAAQAATIETTIAPWREEIKRLKADSEARERAAREVEQKKAAREIEAARASLNTAKADGAVLPGFKAPAEWTNAGTQSAQFAFETHCWAIDRDDVDTLLSTVNITPDLQARLDAVFAALSPGDKARWGSPLRMLGRCWVDGRLPFSAMRIVGEDLRGGESVVVKVQLQYGDRPADREFVFHRTAAGWKKDVPLEQLESFLRRSHVIP